MNGDPLFTLGSRVGFLDVRAYLEARGWRRVPSSRSYAAIYRSIQAPPMEVQVPLDRDLADYAEAMVVIARRVAEHEGRSAESVLHDLLQPHRDLLRFGLEGDTTRDGGVSLADGLDLVNGVRKALLASACSVRKPRAFHPRMGLAEADAFVRQCRLGQTEVGSFVLTVETPLDIGLQPTLGGEPFGRQTAALLLQSVAYLAGSVRAGEPQRVLEPAKGAPVLSANLCEALVEMMPSDESADLRLRGSWSPLLPLRPGVVSEVHVDRKMYESIERVAHQLRPLHESQPDQFVGTVVELMGGPGDRGEVEGTVVLQVQVDDELLKARVTLGAVDYRKAARAHLEQRYVTVRGILRRGPRVHWVEQSSGFELVGGPPTTAS
ncbi:hypothetical protein [Pyxidicoccus xibeiensis]|uniref:hypothetical protein n=1 Tax=Pyxidicoccus xibeiensis TaxID=2906759 RepID=UPI0020A700B9|nr:hypothetical protein [Pyxidicoccus xibeiensis]MCP3135853.1 hypothetical protein [Pyxidicoccus xibeiensis]